VLLGPALNRAELIFEQGQSKIMTVYVAEIEGRGTVALHANNGSDAKRFARDRVFTTIS
jgi:hypothetical protein